MNLLTAMRYLVALDEHRHFGRAAQACHVTQPALSNGIRSLEAQFGVVIVRRARAYGGLTPEGEVVLRSAQRMLREHESMMQTLRGNEAAPRGRLRMAAVPTAMPLLSRFAALLRKRYPGIVPVVLSLSSQELEKRLDDLTLDLALGYVERMPVGHLKLRDWQQLHERYYLLQRREASAAAAAAPVSALSYGVPIPWAQAGSLPLCLLTPDMYNRTLIDQALAGVGVAASAAIETNSVLTLVLAVQAGDVATVLPGAMLDVARGHPHLEARPLVEPDLRTPIGFMTQAAVEPSLALQAALALLDDPSWREQLAAFGDDGAPG